MAAVALMKAPLSRAASATWNGNAAVGVAGDGVSWSNPDNWTTDGIVDAAPSNAAPGDDLTFGGGTVGQINLQANRVANSLTFTAGFTLVGGGNTLAVATGDVTVNSAISAVIDAQVTGSSVFTKLGGGTLTLEDGDAASGGINVSAGTLAISDLAIASGAISVASSSAIEFGADDTVNGSIASYGAVSILSGSTVSFTSNADSYTQSAGSLTVGGQLLLAGSTFNDDGGTVSGTITLNVDKNMDEPTLVFGSGSESGGTFLFDGFGANISGSLVPSGAAVQFQPSPASYSGGFLSFTTADVTNAGNLQFIGAPSVSETTGITGTLTNTGSISFSAVGSPSGNADYFAGTLNNSGTLTVGAPVVFQEGGLSNSGTVTIAAGQTLNLEEVVFSQTAGSILVAGGATLNAGEGAVEMNGGTITLAADTASPGRMLIDYLMFNAPSGTATIATGPVGAGQSPGYVDLEGATAIFDVSRGTATDDVVISASMTDGAIEKTSAGIMLISGQNSYSSATVDGGTLVIGAAGALPAGAGVTIGAAGTMRFAPNIGGQAISSLAIAGGGKLDVDNNHIVLSYGASDPISSIRGLLVSGYNSGNWNGIGIDTSAATGSKYGLGYADGADGGISGITSGQIEVKYTLYGDTNLDGAVNSIDFGDMAANFGKSGKVWDQGDFNYDGVVNSIDFGLLAANFGKSLGSSGDVVSATDWEALDAFAAANGLMADVPEPFSVGVMAAAGIMVLMRRKRRRE
ncbi:MAG TPA: autotransporter-associated beta strand repeat-containing protein [Tepidisphaeraceae bacterium]|nr:autotransporter-associated beta strand repeat-containing protein [Tepidisphaeraceae bacterium]